MSRMNMPTAATSSHTWDWRSKHRTQLLSLHRLYHFLLAPRGPSPNTLIRNPCAGAEIACCRWVRIPGIVHRYSHARDPIHAIGMSCLAY